MTHAHLIKAIADELREATKELKLRTEYPTVPNENNFVPVNIFLQALPLDLFEETSYFPCILVSWEETQDTLRGEEIKSVAKVNLSVGTYCKEADGYLDLLHLLEICRLAILKKRIIAQRFSLIDSVIFQAVPEQPLPFMFFSAELQYSFYQPSDIHLEKFF